jgi:Uncharacterised nucleotidyltransferase
MATAAEPRPVLSAARKLRPVPAIGSSSEVDLLLACCADPCGDEHGERIRSILSRPLDWERMLRLVDHHRVVPQVYSELSALSHLVPVQHLNAIRLRYEDNARKTLWFTGELVRIVGHLESVGIKALPYKGPVLAQTLYGEVTRRQFSDLDILTLPTDVLKAKAALHDLGYKTAIELAPRIETAYVKTGYEYSFSAAHRSNLLELQWRILPRFYSIDFDVADFFERSDEIVVGGCRMRTLRAEDLLLVLCVHAAKHLWVQLSWLCDIAQLVKTGRLDWNVIQDEARRLGIERIVSLNLLLAQKLLGSQSHSSRQTWAFQKDPSTAVLDEILRIIERGTHCDTESLSYFRLMMRLREHWQDRARLLWRLTVTPSVSEWSAIQLPQPLQPLYRLLRLSRLAKRLASAG